MAFIKFSQLPASVSFTDDDLLALSILSPTVSLTAATITAQGVDQSYQDSGDGFLLAGFAEGDQINVSGFDGGGPNNLFSATVTSVTAGALVIGGSDGDPIVDEIPAGSVTIRKWISVRMTLADVATYIAAEAGIGDVVGPASAVDQRVAVFDGTSGKLIADGGKTIANISTQSIIIACSDESTALTTGVAKVTFRMPYAFTLAAVRASVGTAPTGANLIVDINEDTGGGATSILSTKLSIDAGEKTSTTAGSPAVISDTALADDAEITIDIDQIGSTIAGAGLKVSLIGSRT